MANRIPLIVDGSSLTLKELPSGDVLDLAGSNFVANDATANTLTATAVNSTTATVTTVSSTTLTANTLTTTAVNSTTVTATSFTSNTVTANSISTSSGLLDAQSPISETFSTVTSSSNATTLDLTTSSNFEHTLTENTTFTFSNPAVSGKATSFTLKIVQDASASGYTVTWPSSVDWPSATAPTLTATASAVDLFVFYTNDGGTTWYGLTAGANLA